MRERRVQRVGKEKRLLDVYDVAKFWGVHPETVRMQARMGKLQPVTNHPLLFNAEDIYTFPVPRPGRPKGWRKYPVGKEVAAHE